METDATRTEDRRIRRTKRLLREALLELIAERGYEEVSVQEILERSDVGRTSFYTYFRSKEDLLLRSLEGLGSLFDTPQKAGEKDSPLAGEATLEQKRGKESCFSLSLFGHLEENRKLAKTLLGRGGIPIVKEHLQIQLRDHYRSRLRGPGFAGLNEFQKEGTALFAGGALLSLILWWIDMDPPATPEKMSELFENLLQSRWTPGSTD